MPNAMGECELCYCQQDKKGNLIEIGNSKNPHILGQRPWNQSGKCKQGTCRARRQGCSNMSHSGAKGRQDLLPNKERQGYSWSNEENGRIIF